MSMRNRILGFVGAGLAVIVLSSCQRIPNQDFCLVGDGPKTSPIPTQQVYRGSSIRIPLGLKPGQEAYLSKAPQGMVLDAEGNIVWSACGNSDEGDVENVEVAVLDECGASTQSVEIDVLPREGPVYINPLDQVDLTVGDSAQVPVITTPQNPGLPISLDGGSVEWVTLEGNTILANPFYTFNGNVKLITTDGCLIERQPLPLVITPKLVNGVSYDYFRKLNVHNLNNPADIEDFYRLVRQEGTGFPNKDLGNLASIIENSLSGKYTVNGTHARVWDRPVFVHVGDEGQGNLCHFPGDAGEYMPGHIKRQNPSAKQ